MKQWRGKRSENLIHRCIGKGPNFLIGAILNRVGDKDTGRGEAECPRLVARRVLELAGGDEDTGNALLLQSGEVMHTARRARPSVG